MSNQQTALKYVIAGMMLFLTSSMLYAAAPKKPNVLIIMADDCTHRDLNIYGGQNAKTPNIDSFADEALVFDCAYLAEAICQPCRAELYSGLFPMRNGCAWNHSKSRSTITTMPQHLKPLGYRTGIAGKIHVGPRKAFPFENVKGFDGNCVRNPTNPHDTTYIKEFMGRSDTPFCLVVALVEPHVPWVMGDKSQYPADKIKLPPNIADTPVTRDAFARYLAEITYMDSQVGDILKTLQSTGKAANTLVLFTSEQGAQFPGCKWTNYDTGLHTALIARWPGVIDPKVRTAAMIQYADVLPTLLDIAGGNPADHDYDGTSFLPVLLGKTQTHRKYAYGTHNNVPEGPPYPIRTVTDGRYRYIRNLTPDEIYIERHLMGWAGRDPLKNPYWATWVATAADNQHTYDLVKRYMSRPAEELYDIQNDPYEMNNLVGNPTLTSIKKTLSVELDNWLKEQNDPGVPQDTTEALKASRNDKHLYGTPPKQKRQAAAPR